MPYQDDLYYQDPNQPDVPYDAGTGAAINPLPAPTQSQGGSAWAPDWDAARRDLEQRAAAVGASDTGFSDVQHNMLYDANVGNQDAFNALMAEQYARIAQRGASTSDRIFDSQSGYYDTNTFALNPAGQAEAAKRNLNPSGYYSGSIPQALRPNTAGQQAKIQEYGKANKQQLPTSPIPAQPPRMAPSSVPNTSPSFTDPPSRLVEDYALDRFQQLQNPNPNSGTAMFEQYARELVETLKQPIYSPQDEAVIKGKAISSIEQERDATKRRWIEELSRRGLRPSDGPALEGILKIDEHFNQARSTFEREFALSAIQQTRDQRMQGLNTLGALAGSEEGRLDKGLSYATLPYELENNAFQRNLQMVGAGGSPSSLLQSALAIAQATQNDERLNQQERAAQVGAILEFIEGLGI